MLIYGTSVALRTILLRLRMTLFEVVQATIAFLLVAEAILHFGPAAGAPWFGITCLTLSAAAYAGAFVCFYRRGDSRNSTVYATWGLALFLAGNLLCLPPHWQISTLGIAAILAAFFGSRRSCLTLQLHGLICVISAAIASGLLPYATHTLTGPFPEPLTGIAWLIALTPILCYSMSSRNQLSGWKERPLQVLSAILAAFRSRSHDPHLNSVWLAAAVITPGESHVAVIRTLSGCLLALVLAWFGSRWQRAELLWITYGLLALVAAKLLFEDLRQGHPEFIAASIFVYAVTLILVPQSRPAIHEETTHHQRKQLGLVQAFGGVGKD